jgi:hypothetical protein
LPALAQETALSCALALPPLAAPLGRATVSAPATPPVTHMTSNPATSGPASRPVMRSDLISITAPYLTIAKRNGPAFD